MSGGILDYFYSRLEERAGDFQDRELDDLVRDLAKLFHDREWYLSGDTCEGKWNEARDEFKKKWFTDIGRQERIEKYLDDIKYEMMKCVGLYDKYCRKCKHWRPEQMPDDPYGICDLCEGCLKHRSTSCEKFEYM